MSWVKKSPQLDAIRPMHIPRMNSDRLALPPTTTHHCLSSSCGTHPHPSSATMDRVVSTNPPKPPNQWPLTSSIHIRTQTYRERERERERNEAKTVKPMALLLVSISSISRAKPASRSMIPTPDC